LWMDYNNPCVIQAGDTYYLTAATHHYMGMPLLKSKDLINWSHAGRIYQDLRPLSADFDFPGKAYSAGSQDAEIAYHRGTYYLFNWSTRYRGFMSTAPSPEGPWSPVRKIRDSMGGAYEDPCPFWDDDGKAYLLLVGNPGPLTIHPLNASFDEIEGKGTTLISDIPPKGPQMIKRGEFYYILVARTGPHKAQYAYRSKSLFGPYEGRLIFEGKQHGIQAAQGSLVPVKGDDWAFIHHEYDMGSVYGRRVYLQPAGWRDDWPSIGVDPDGDGVGEPVGLKEPFPKPPLPAQPPSVPELSDGFDGGKIADQWMWNHHPDLRYVSLDARPGWLRLTARALNTNGGDSQYPRLEVKFHEDHLLFAYNTLIQRFCGSSSTITTCLDTTGMREGERAGLCTLSGDYTWIGIRLDEGKRKLVFAKGDARNGPISTETGAELNQDLVWLRLSYHQAKGSFSYSFDGRSFTSLGPAAYSYQSTWYEGTKVGLFNYSRSNVSGGGFADFDFFSHDHDGPNLERP
ncbi:MAG: family 43 glycosylhydrolase, partial [Akkermansiaceae bacterium]|nr:family 43 glycosylhydrolase [Akkermansiaceae bacterium]